MPDETDARSETFTTNQGLPAGAGASRTGKRQGIRLSTEGTGTKRRTVVILDKDPFFREFQRSLLASHDCEVVTPTEPEEFTADHITGLRPTIIITEILLPGTNGLDLIRDLKAEPQLGDCTIVVFSVLHAEARSLAAGADKFVQKPLMRQEYLTTIIDRLKGATDEATK